MKEKHEFPFWHLMPLNSTGGAQSIMLVKQCSRETAAQEKEHGKNLKLENWNYAIRISKA